MNKTETFRKKFLEKHPDYAERKCTSWHFCNDRESADNLLKLVLDDIKHGTASLLDSYKHDKEPVPKEGDLSIITDWEGTPHCILETVRVWIYKFSEVPESFAAIEGEGDGSLEYWRNVHDSFFREEAEELGLSFTEDSEIICEQFRVLFP